MSYEKKSQNKIDTFNLDGYDKLPTFKVSGGLGKHIVFSSLLPAIISKYGKINILSSYPEVFLDNEDIQLSLGFVEYEQYKYECSKVISKIYYQEPYGSEFDFNEQHILDWWVQAYDLEDDLVVNPIVNVNKDIKNKATDIKKDLNNKYILVQFSGGQTAIDFNDNSVYQQTEMIINRNYPYQMAQILVNKLKFKYPDYKIINVSLPNEYNLINTERLPINFKTYFELINDASLIICIDSMLQHISASTENKNTIVLWNKLSYTPSIKYGWGQHINMEEPNMCIDYNLILEESIKIMNTKEC